MNVNNYTPDQIIDILYKNRFQNYKVNRLLKLYEKEFGGLKSPLTFDGKAIVVVPQTGKVFTKDLDRLANSKRKFTFSLVHLNPKN